MGFGTTLDCYAWTSFFGLYVYGSVSQAEGGLVLGFEMLRLTPLKLLYIGVNVGLVFSILILNLPAAKAAALVGVVFHSLIALRLTYLFYDGAILSLSDLRQALRKDEGLVLFTDGLLFAVSVLLTLAFFY